MYGKMQSPTTKKRKFQLFENILFFCAIICSIKPY